MNKVYDGKGHKKRIHYAWFVLIGCCMLQGGTLGVIWNASGVFYVPVCSDLGFRVSEMAFYRTISGITAIISLPIASKLFNRYDSRIVLTVSALLFALPTIAMGTFTDIGQWYVAGAIQGLVSNLVTMIAAPIILSNWFKEKTGIVTGISASFSGVVGALTNYFLSQLVERFGWRVGYFFLGTLSLVIVLPATLFILRYKPEDKKLIAYGAPVIDKIRQTKDPAIIPSAQPKRIQFFMIMIASVCAGGAAAFLGVLNAFGISVGLLPSAAALCASICMIGNTTGKLIVGGLNDRMGTRNAALMAYSVSLLGTATLLLGNSPFIYLSSFLYGFVMPAYTTMVPLVIRSTMGNERFPKAYSRVTMVSSFAMSIMPTVYGWIFDSFESYTYCLVLMTILMVIGCVMIIFVFKEKTNE